MFLLQDNVRSNQADHIEYIIVSSVFDILLFSMFCYAGHGVFKERDNTQTLTRRSELTPCTQLLLFQVNRSSNLGLLCGGPFSVTAFRSPMSP